ncbi:MAG: hypothetical protein MUF87_10120 [Anaerolineae bacterium]|jgi:hypothetical protein|nr:hypothetical protein [Anaerolineae bacterium]
MEDRIDRLLDAIELIKLDRREEARSLLRQLIQEDGDFEDAWLWMSVAVDSIDQSSVCLDNVLRVNPRNTHAAGALYRLRESEMQMEQRRNRYRFYRDLAFIALWLLIFGVLFAVMSTYFSVLG